jgi:WD40 repeat protein
VLIDFGVARPLEASDLTGGVGTHLWRAPEVVGGIGDPGPASDAWGVGALAYWVLVREPPPLDSAAAAREKLVPAARAAGFPDPVGLAHHITRLLELRPSRRPSDLDRWADELGAIARRSTARRLAKPVAAGTMAVFAVGLAAWVVAPGVARVGRQDNSGREVAAGLITESQLLSLTEPPVALAMAAEARHRDPSADSSKAVASTYDAFSRTGILATLHGHTDSVSGEALSPDGRPLAGPSDDHTAKVWDASNHEQEAGDLTLDTGASSIAFDPADPTSVAVGAADGTIRLWDRATSAAHELGRVGGSVQALAFNADGSRLAAGVERGEVTVWDVADGTVTATIPGPHRGVAFSADQDLLAVGSGAGVALHDPTTGELRSRLDLDIGEVSAVAASADGTVIAAGSVDGRLVVWDLTTDELTPMAAKHGGNVLALALRDDGKLLASASSDGSAKVWDVVTGKEVANHLGHRGGVQTVAFSRTGSEVATGGDDTTVKLWRAVGGRELVTLRGSGRPLHGLAYSPDGTMIAGSDTDGNVEVWDAATAATIQAFEADGDAVFDVAFSPDSSVLVTAGADGLVRLWQPRTGDQLEQLAGHTRSVWTVAFSPDGTLLASGSGDGTVRLWDRSTDQPATPRLLNADTGRVNAVAFSPDGKQLASAGDHGKVSIWDLTTGQPSQPSHELDADAESTIALAFSPDGATLVTGGDDETVKVWDVANGKLEKELAGHHDTVSALAFQPDGRLLASGSDDRTVQLWDPADWDKVDAFTADGRRVLELDFSPDGTRLASAGGEGVVKLWPTTPISADQICQLIGAHVTAERLQEALGADVEPEACTDLDP